MVGISECYVGIGRKEQHPKPQRWLVAVNVVDCARDVFVGKNNYFLRLFELFVFVLFIDLSLWHVI